MGFFDERTGKYLIYTRHSRRNLRRVLRNEIKRALSIYIPYAGRDLLSMTLSKEEFTALFKKVYSGGRRENLDRLRVRTLTLNETDVPDIVYEAIFSIFDLLWEDGRKEISDAEKRILKHLVKSDPRKRGLRFVVNLFLWYHKIPLRMKLVNRKSVGELHIARILAVLRALGASREFARKTLAYLLKRNRALSMKISKTMFEEMEKFQLQPRNKTFV